MDNGYFEKYLDTLDKRIERVEAKLDTIHDFVVNQTTAIANESKRKDLFWLAVGGAISAVVSGVVSFFIGGSK